MSLVNHEPREHALRVETTVSRRASDDPRARRGGGGEGGSTARIRGRPSGSPRRSDRGSWLALYSTEDTGARSRLVGIAPPQRGDAAAASLARGRSERMVPLISRGQPLKRCAISQYLTPRHAIAAVEGPQPTCQDAAAPPERLRPTGVPKTTAFCGRRGSVGARARARSLERARSEGRFA